MVNAKEVYNKLLEVEKLVMNPSTFCKGAYAMDNRGNPEHSLSNEACRWCILGAIEKITNKSSHELFTLRDVLNKSIHIHFGQPKTIPALNDNYPRKDRQAVFNIAKEKLKEKINEE